MTDDIMTANKISFVRVFKDIAENIVVAKPIRIPVINRFWFVLLLHPHDWVNQSIINGVARTETSDPRYRGLAVKNQVSNLFIANREENNPIR